SMGTTESQLEVGTDRFPCPLPDTDESRARASETARCATSHHRSAWDSCRASIRSIERWDAKPVPRSGLYNHEPSDRVGADCAASAATTSSGCRAGRIWLRSVQSTK